MGRLIIISGPSGVGKGTVVSELMKRDDSLFLSISATTRKPRTGERDGVNYYFLSDEQFREKIERGELLEYDEFVGGCYGTPEKPVDDALARGKNVILEITLPGALTVIKKRPDVISVFIEPPSFEELERRLRFRATDTEEKIRRRLNKAREECEAAKFFTHRIVNRDVKQCADEIYNIIHVKR